MLHIRRWGKYLRKIMPKAYILVPGYGAQGGKGADLVHFFNEDGLGAIVNSSTRNYCGIQAGKICIFWRLNIMQMLPVQAVKDMIADISSALEQPLGGLL